MTVAICRYLVVLVMLPETPRLISRGMVYALRDFGLEMPLEEPTQTSSHLAAQHRSRSGVQPIHKRRMQIGG